MEELKKQIEDLNGQVERLQEIVLKDDIYKRDYGNKDIYDNEQEFRSGLTLKRIPTSDTNLPVGRVWNDSGTLKIKQ